MAPLGVQLPHFPNLKGQSPQRNAGESSYVREDKEDAVGGRGFFCVSLLEHKTIIIIM